MNNNLETRRPSIEHNGYGLAVSSEVVAVGAGIQHKSVLELITKHNEQLVRFGLLSFETRARSVGQHGGGDVRVALLNEQQATLLMTFMRNTAQVIDFKVALVEAFYEMAKQLTSPTRPTELTRSDLARMILDSESEKLELSSKLEVAQPKADFMDTYVSGDGDSMLFRTVASTLRITESKLRELLISAEWIYAEDSSRRNSKGVQEPQRRYSEYASTKLCFTRHQEPRSPRFRGELDHTLKITPVGAERIDRMLGRAIAKFGDLDTAIAGLEERRQERIAARKTKNTTEDLF